MSQARGSLLGVWPERRENTPFLLLSAALSATTRVYSHCRQAPNLSKRHDDSPGIRPLTLIRWNVTLFTTTLSDVYNCCIHTTDVYIRPLRVQIVKFVRIGALFISATDA